LPNLGDFGHKGRFLLRIPIVAEIPKTQQPNDLDQVGVHWSRHRPRHITACAQSGFSAHKPPARYGPYTTFISLSALSAWTCIVDVAWFGAPTMHHSAPPTFAAACSLSDRRNSVHINRHPSRVVPSAQKPLREETVLAFLKQPAKTTKVYVQTKADKKRVEDLTKLLDADEAGNTEGNKTLDRAPEKAFMPSSPIWLE
jgi:hypothetical protein